MTADQSIFRGAPSLPMRFAVRFLDAGPTKRILGDATRTMAEAQKTQANPATAPRRAHRHASFSRVSVGGIDVVEALPKRGAVVHQVMYLHGGGYINPMVSHHWTLLAELARRYRARVVAPLYRLAPVGNAEQCLSDITNAYRHYFGGADTGPLLAGDSAGGGLAVALTATLRDSGIEPLPRHLGLFAPWLDVTLRNPAIAVTAAEDPTLDPVGLRHAGIQWAGSINPSDPRVSPVNADVSDFPATTIYVGSRDILLHDCRIFLRHLQKNGVDAELQVAPGAFHAFPVATMLPESTRVLSHLFIRAFGGA